MPHEDVELARRAFDALARRDVEGFLELVDREVEFTSLLQESEGTVYRGHEGVRKFLASVLAVFPDWTPTVESAESVGGGVIVRARFDGTGATSQMAIAQVMWQVAWAEDGRVVSWAWFRSEEEAREAVRRHRGERHHSLRHARR